MRITENSFFQLDCNCQRVKSEKIIREYWLKIKFQLKLKCFSKISHPKNYVFFLYFFKVSKL